MRGKTVFGNLRSGLSLVLATVLAWCPAAVACFQGGRLPLELAAKEVKGRAMQDGKPLRDARLVLEKAEESALIYLPWLRGVVKTTATDIDGNFDFGEIPAGLYVIETTSPLGMTVVRVKAPQAQRDHEIELIFFGDGCEGARTIELPVRLLPPSRAHRSVLDSPPVVLR